MTRRNVVERQPVHGTTGHAHAADRTVSADPAVRRAAAVVQSVGAVMRSLRLLLLAIGTLVAGCAGATNVGASEWSMKYSKAGLTTEQQLNNDGLDCHWNAK